MIAMIEEMVSVIIQKLTRIHQKQTQTKLVSHFY